MKNNYYFEAFSATFSGTVTATAAANSQPPPATAAAYCYCNCILRGSIENPIHHLSPTMRHVNTQNLSNGCGDVVLAVQISVNTAFMNPRS